MPPYLSSRYIAHTPCQRNQEDVVDDPDSPPRPSHGSRSVPAISANKPHVSPRVHQPPGPSVYSRPVESFDPSVPIGPTNGIHVPSPPTSIQSLQPPCNLISYIQPQPIYRPPHSLVTTQSRSIVQPPVYSSATNFINSQEEHFTNISVHSQSRLVPPSSGYRQVNPPIHCVPINHLDHHHIPIDHPDLHHRAHGPPPYASGMPTNPNFVLSAHPNSTHRNPTPPPAPPIQDKTSIPAKETNDVINIVSSPRDGHSDSGDALDDEISVRNSLSLSTDANSNRSSPTFQRTSSNATGNPMGPHGCRQPGCPTHPLRPATSLHNHAEATPRIASTLSIGLAISSLVRSSSTTGSLNIPNCSLLLRNHSAKPLGLI